MKLTQKQLILIVGITTLIIAGGLVGVAWYYNEHKDQSVNTSTSETNSNSNNSELVKYENTAWAFSFEYPPFMGSLVQEVDLTNDPSTYFNGKGLLRVYTPGQNPYLDIYIVDDSISNVRKWIEDFAKNDPPKTVEWANVKINNIDAERGAYSYNLEGTYFYNQYVFSRLDKTWVVGTFNSEGEEDAAIQNLKFEIKDVLSLDTSDWQTYTNTETGYLIKYPPDWAVKENDNAITIATQEKSSDPFQTPYISISLKSSLYPEDACLMQDKIITLNNKQYRQQEEGCSYAGSTVATFFPSNNKYIVVSWTTDVEESFDTYNAILASFLFSDEAQEPKISTVNLKDQFPGIKDSWWFEISMMGDEALIGGSHRSLLRYDGKTIEDISNLARQEDALSDPSVTGIHNNGEYWIFEVYGSNYDYVYKLTGDNLKQIKPSGDITSWDRPPFHWQWSKDKWLTYTDDSFYWYDGSTFTKINNSPNPSDLIKTFIDTDRVIYCIRKNNVDTTYQLKNGEFTKIDNIKNILELSDLSATNGDYWISAVTNWEDEKPVYRVITLKDGEIKDISGIFNDQLKKIKNVGPVLSMTWFNNQWIFGMSEGVISLNSDLNGVKYLPEFQKSYNDRWFEGSAVGGSYALIGGMEALVKVEKQDLVK
ncbi:MAG: hypothetical protein WC495_00700 [Patescibacteria group bacterium]|jgi:hypothetical protein